MSAAGFGARRALWSKTAPLAIALAVAAAPLAGQDVRWTGSTSYSSGSYVFDQTTRTWSISNGLSLTLGPVELTGSLPVIVQNSTWVSRVGDLTLPTGGEESAAVQGRQSGATVGSRPGRGSGGPGSTTPPPDPGEVTYANAFEWNVGDPYLGASAALHEGSGFVRSLRAQLGAKAPLRDLDSGVGTGEWDAGLGGSAFAAVGRTFLFVNLAYWWLGDLPDLELRDGAIYGAGISRGVLDARGAIMASFFGGSRMIESMERPGAVDLSVSYSPRLGRSVSGGVTVGLTEASPDLTIHLGWSLIVR